MVSSPINQGVAAADGTGDHTAAGSTPPTAAGPHVVRGSPFGGWRRKETVSDGYPAPLDNGKGDKEGSCLVARRIWIDISHLGREDRSPGSGSRQVPKVILPKSRRRAYPRLRVAKG